MTHDKYKHLLDKTHDKQLTGICPLECHWRILMEVERTT